jgi:hypothetical protein
MDDSRYAGMSVNERLFAAGLIDQWDAAARRRDREAMVALLRRVVADAQAEQIADQILPVHPSMVSR